MVHLPLPLGLATLLLHGLPLGVEGPQLGEHGVDVGLVPLHVDQIGLPLLPLEEVRRFQTEDVHGQLQLGKVVAGHLPGDWGVGQLL